MPRLPRIFQKIFAEDASANPNIGQFGSLAAGTPTYTKDLTQIQALSRFKEGWASATIDDQSPALEDMNALFFLAYSQIAYLLQQGVPEWNSSTTYYTGQFASSAGVIYVSLTNDNTAAVSDTNNWRRLVPKQQTAFAWANFSGTAGDTSLTNAYNISSITRNDTGDYSFTFSTAAPNANYVIVANGAAFGTVPYYQRGQFLGEFFDTDGNGYKTTGGFRLAAGSESDTAEDTLRGYVVIYAD